MRVLVAYYYCTYVNDILFSIVMNLVFHPLSAIKMRFASLRML